MSPKIDSKLLSEYETIMNHLSHKTDTQLIQYLKCGDKNAANILFERYFDRVVRAAQSHLNKCYVPGCSGDDIAASVFESLWERAHETRFADDELADSKELWKLLCKMIYYKTRTHARRESAAKRNGRANPVELSEQNVGNVANHQLIADNLASFKEEHERVLSLLGDSILSQIALMRLEGYSVAEISANFGKSLRWTGRKLSMIRDIWRAELEPAQ